MTYDEFQQLPLGEVVYDTKHKHVWHKARTRGPSQDQVWESPGRIGYFWDGAVYSEHIVRVGNVHG